FYCSRRQASPWVSFVRLLKLLNLAERQFDRSFPAKDGYEDVQLLALGVDLGNRTRQGCEGAIDHVDGFAHLEVGLDRGSARGGGVRVGRGGVVRREQQRHDLVEREQHGLVSVAHK